MVNLIIPAAGKGLRFSKDIPKQFVKIQGHEVLELNLLFWINVKFINKIYLILPQKEFKNYENKYKNLSEKIISVVGGDSRAESINNAIKILESNNKYTLIHDGARPFITNRLIGRVLEALEEHKAVIPALKLTDTIKEVKGNKVIKTINRENLVSVQTPQGFHTDIIRKAYSNLNLNNINFDDAELVEHIGETVFYVLGEKNNIKITTRDDLDYAKFLIKNVFKK
jgi:2-C-methyl-D-erythritol 4-phosphate cytidylyltransferase